MGKTRKNPKKTTRKQPDVREVWPGFLDMTGCMAQRRRNDQPRSFARSCHWAISVKRGRVRLNFGIQHAAGL